MKRRVAVTLLVANVVLGSLAAADCDTPATPKSQCQDGAQRGVHSKSGTTYQECHNGEWTTVDCFSGSTKTTSNGVHYACEGGEWKRKA